MVRLKPNLVLRSMMTAMILIADHNNQQLCSAAPVIDDICEFVTGQQIYCNCDSQGADEARDVTCFIVDDSVRFTPDGSVWKGFQSQRKIESLVLTTRFENNKLSFLPVSALRNFADSLQTLNVNEMSLSSLEPYSLSNFSKLSKAILEHNELSALSESAISHLPALGSLSLASNGLRKLPANVFVELPKLHELFLDRNQLTTIEDNAFAHLKHLRELDLRHNRLESISAQTFAGLEHLKRLDLSINRLRAVPNRAFVGTPVLRELELNQNEIVTVEENAFHSLGHLMSLLLNQNNLKHLPPTLFADNPLLALINLSENILETLEHQLVSGLQHLNSEQFVMYFKENLLECDCRLIWMANASRTAGQLLKREIKQAKCTVKREFANLVVGEQIKVTKLGQNETFVAECQQKLLASESVDKIGSNWGHNSGTISEELESQRKTANESAINTLNGNDLEMRDRSPESLASKTTKSVENKIADTDNSLADAVPNMSDSKQRDYNDNSKTKSNAESDGSGGAFAVERSVTLVMSSLVTIIVFCVRINEL